MRRRAITAALLAALVAAQAAWAQVEGKTTLDVTIAPGAEGPFRFLQPGPGEARMTREDGLGSAQAGRTERRRSLLYFGQLSDMHIIDEESPARVENVDTAVGGPFSAAWRPMEAFGPHTTDAAIRQVNSFSDASPHAEAGGRRARMELVITTGDSADNQQHNETGWVVRLLDGGTLNPNSGVGNGACGTDPAEAPRYTGVSDLDDYTVPSNEFYDPDQPAGSWSDWPQYPGLLDRAQQPFETPGLNVPSYVTFGNHDGLAQGNQAANAAFEAVGTGCLKPTGAALGTLAPVPPDPDRRFVSKAQYKQLHRTGAPDAHGFGLVDPAEEQASNGAAGYYSWSPKPGFRFIALDTVCDAGVAGPSADGNIDHPQFQWLERELAAAGRADQLVVLFSHHAIASLTCAVPDEQAPPCLGNDPHGHDVNPGCDVDPRSSSPVHVGDDVEQMVLSHPHVAAWVAGHSHVNRIEPHRRSDGSGFWGIRVAAEIDWPQQSRLLEFMDNRDGTLSILGTILDHSAPVAAPAPGASAAAFSPLQLASLGRVFAANDPQGGIGTGTGEAKDRNVELMLRDPRRNPLDPTSGRGGTARRCAALRGRIRGKRVHRAVLGRRSRAIRRSYPASSRRSRGRTDTFCLADGKRVRVRYRRGRRAAVIVTTSRHFKVRRVRVGMSRRAFRRRVRGERRVRGGWWIARAKRASAVFKVRGGRVRGIGLAQRRATATRTSSRRLFRGF